MVVLLALLLVGLNSCSVVNYRTYLDGARDPEYDFSSVRTIGLAPLAWTESGRANQLDELKEKEFLLYFRSELARRGYSAVYLEPDKLEERSGRIALKPPAAHYDLLLTCEFGIQPVIVKVPGEAFGRQDSYGGYYSKTQSYEVQTYDLTLAAYLWAEAPEYRRKVWYARINQGSPAPDLSARAPELIARLLREKFPVNRTDK